MRGTQWTALAVTQLIRIIPAHAGNSRDWQPSLPEIPDHPRACGELIGRIDRNEHLGGSSPRMRGTLCHEGFHDLDLRIIPAHAGNSHASTFAGRPQSDHPRACGELSGRSDMRCCSSGSSPRMRGTPRLSRRQILHIRIIPAHAGNSAESTRAIWWFVRIIPAHAGNSQGFTALLASPSDHPRACGELRTLSLTEQRDAGSSPRMRGTLRAVLDTPSCPRIIPAHAGNSHFLGPSRIA